MDLKTWLRANWDRALGVLVTGIGLLAIVLGYLGIKDTPYPAEQIPYVVSGAVMGIGLIGIGLTLWLSADLRDEWHKLDRIELLLEGRVDDRGPDETVADELEAAPGAALAVADGNRSPEQLQATVNGGSSRRGRGRLVATERHS